MKYFEIVVEQEGKEIAREKDLIYGARYSEQHQFSKKFADVEKTRYLMLDKIQMIIEDVRVTQKFTTIFLEEVVDGKKITKPDTTIAIKWDSNPFDIYRELQQKAGNDEQNS